MTRAESDRLAQDLSVHRGEWVVVRDSRVIASAPTVKAAVAKVPKEKRSGMHLQYAPKEDFSASSFSAR